MSPVASLKQSCARLVKVLPFRFMGIAQEHDWVIGLRAGRVDVFRTVFEHYTPQLWKFARLSVPSDVAEDIVQDVLFDLWNRRAATVRDSLTQYLFGAVRHGVWRYLRRERMMHSTNATPTDDLPWGMGSPDPTPDETAVASDLRSATVIALESLSEVQRAILTLRWAHEMTYEQIAEILSITPDAARQQASRTQRVIRPLLERFRSSL